MTDGRDVTVLLQAWRNGDPNALDRLIPLIYGELRRIAAGHLRRESAAHTMQPTALVHEAYLRLAASSDPEFVNREHFLGVACRVMRQILVENARARLAAKRGGGAVRVPLDDDMAASDEAAGLVVGLHDALSSLEEQDPEAARVLELKFFGGLTAEECSRLLGVSVHQVNWQLRLARAWLRRELNAAPAPDRPIRETPE